MAAQPARARQLRRLVGTGLYTALLSSATGLAAQTPTARLSGPDVVEYGDTVVFDASGSMAEGRNRLVRFVWTLSDGEEVTTDVPELEFPTSGVASTVGQHTIALVVIDSEGTRSRSTEHRFTVRDTQAPTAVLQIDQVHPGQSELLLDGSASHDNAQLSQFRWRFTEGGVNSEVIALGEFQTADAVWTLHGDDGGPLAPGQHRLELTVVDDSGNESMPTVVEFVVPAVIAPTAVLQAPAQAEWGEPLLLDGSASTEGSGEVDRFEWESPVFHEGTITTNTPGLAILPSGQGQAPPGDHTSISAEVPPGSHTFTLRVTDTYGNQSVPVGVEVVVRDTQAPTAVLQIDAVHPGQSALVLDGSASYDNAQLSQFRWRFTEGGVNSEVIALGEFQTADAVWTLHGDDGGPLAPGQHRLQLTVVDNSGNESVPTAVEFVVPAVVVPTAVLQAPAQVEWGEPFVLDGSASSQGSGGIEQYEWESPVFYDRVTTSTPGLAIVPSGGGQAPPGDHTSIGADVPLGTHTFTLRVTDSYGNQSVPVVAEVVVRDSRAPTASVATPRSIRLGSPVTLDARRSRDAGPGTIEEYRWTRLEGGGGNWRVRESRTTYEPSITIGDRRSALQPGDHTFQLVVVDAAGNRSRAVRVSFTVPRR